MKINIKYIREFVVNIISLVYIISIYSLSIYRTHVYVSSIFENIVIDKTLLEIILCACYIVAYFISTLFIILTLRFAWYKLVRGSLPKNESYIKECSTIFNDIAFISCSVLLVSIIFISVALLIGEAVQLIPYDIRENIVISLLGIMIVVVIGACITDKTKNIK